MTFKTIGSFVVLITSVMLLACAPYEKVSYFSPVLHHGIRVLTGFSGLDNIAQFQLSETVELSIVFFEPHSVRILFALPDGEVARFDNANLVATPLDGGKSMVAKIVTIQANHIVDGRGSFRYLTSEDLLEGATYHYQPTFGGSASVHRNFQIDVEFPTSLPDHFQLHIPRLNLTGKVVFLPDVEVERKIGLAYQGSPP